MVLSRRVSLDGIQMDDSHEAIAIQGITTAAPKGSAGAAALAGGGSRRTGGQRETLEITVSFTIIIKRGRASERDAALDAVNSWAAIAVNGAWMRTTMKPGKMIRVFLEEPASLGDAREAGRTFTIKFKAYGVPYWIDETAGSVTLADASYAAGSLQVGGNAQTVVDIEAVNISGAVLNTFIVRAGSSEITLTGLGVRATEDLIIGHTPEGYLQIYARDSGGSARSLLHRRAASSADDLYVNPGMAAVVFSADRACRVTASARGRWL